ncbi:acyl-CoA thioesterase [Aurantibacillus circumpalustris]|uniref:acyl-CoA thioesterase n=1 Tax=Aurantibacillus circumpalustris TaxID=3036359 RepID=UPI00295A7CE8|nr:acyl-CoA thioesterase [Aurantibacillus circumpalustris]
MLKINWADLDLFGHVNNVAFFKYIQAARVNYCELIGLTSLFDLSKNSFMVASSQCEYKSPMHYPGEVSVLCRVDWIKNTSMQLLYELYNSENILVAKAMDVLVVYDHSKKIKVSISSQLKSEIMKIEKRGF